MKTQKIKGSALLGSVLVLFTCLFFLSYYQELLHDSLINREMMIEYFEEN